MEHTPGNLYSPFAPLVERQTPSHDLFSRPWSAMKDSLDMIVRGEDRNVPMPFEITTSEAVFLIAAMPCLEYLYLKQGSVGEKTFKSLRSAFPEYFERIPKKRVDWIDEGDS
ncbi:hypothetical protein BGX30_009026 [Mortierella sp. GBA39]|nr:hypothetical protein BGX30_009026 [Mortierella sp. GBA39]